MDMVRESAFFKSRPKAIQELMEKLPPTHEYRIIETGHIGSIYSYNEKGTVTLTREANEIDRMHGLKAEYINVFGLKPEDIEIMKDKPIQVDDNAVTSDQIINVKVQRSLGGNNEEEMVLIYDESRDFMYEGPMPADIRAKMGEKEKMYAEACLTPDRNDEGDLTGTFKYSIIRLIEDQPW